VIAMLRRPEGATVDEVVSATGWQRHTVRGVFSGTLKRCDTAAPRQKEKPAGGAENPDCKSPPADQLLKVVINTRLTKRDYLPNARDNYRKFVQRPRWEHP
jgi:hypothetical protein